MGGEKNEKPKIEEGAKALSFMVEGGRLRVWGWREFVVCSWGRLWLERFQRFQEV
jgi:hypothetical protein